MLGNRPVVCITIFMIGFTTLSARPLASSVPDSPPGRITGVVNRIEGERVMPVAGVRVFFSSVGEPRQEFESVTDANGTYAVDIPRGVYHEWIEWFGDCPKIRRAVFEIAPAERVKFDFLVIACPIIDTEGFEVPLEESGSGRLSTRGRNENQMDIPLVNQRGGYQDQLFPANDKRWPEIVISFGKYDNGPTQTTYFSLEDQAIRNPPAGRIIVSALPVTITLEHYTVRASTVVLTKRTMTFVARGDVWVSDGVHARKGGLARISFASGIPKIKLKH